MMRSTNVGLELTRSSMSKDDTVIEGKLALLEQAERRHFSCPRYRPKSNEKTRERC